MPKALFVVRATVADAPKRAAFDAWYSREHLPDAVKSFGAEKAWRYWSLTDPALHHAMYQFSDEAALDRATKASRHEPADRRFQPRLARSDAHARGAGAGRGVWEVAPSSSRRRPGPIATGGNCFARWSLSSFSNNAGRGVWVPAFAGTTLRWTRATNLNAQFS